jgi:hypothetical protein
LTIPDRTHCGALLDAELLADSTSTTQRGNSLDVSPAENQVQALHCSDLSLSLTYAPLMTSSFQR